MERPHPDSPLGNVKSEQNILQSEAQAHEDLSHAAEQLHIDLKPKCQESDPTSCTQPIPTIR